MKDDGTGGPTQGSPSESAEANPAIPNAVTSCPHADPGSGTGGETQPKLVTPSGLPDANARPGGSATKVRPQDDEATRRSLTRENEAAVRLAQNGFKVEQNPPKLPNGAKPDFKVEGEYFDCYSPSSSKESMITDTIDAKVPKQADRLVFNLADSPMSTSEVRDVIKRKQADEAVKNGSLKQVIAIKKDGTVENVFP